MGAGQHLYGLCLVAADALFSHIRGLWVSRQCDQPAMIRDIPCVAFGAPDRPLIPFFMATHTLTVMSTLKPDSVWQPRIEGFLMTSGTSVRFRGVKIGRTVMVADEAIL